MKRNDDSHIPGGGRQGADRSRGASGAEALFVARVRQALDESTAALPAGTLAKLALARKAALRAQPVPALRMSPVNAWATATVGPGSNSGFGFGRATLVASAVVLVAACLAGLYRFEEDRRIEDLADVDSAVLNDDLPIAAYADHGFNQFIQQNR
jgi:Protein of unknown function (DUF3619)